MNEIPNIKVCPGTLAEGYNTYSLKCRKAMFNGKKVSHILTFPSPVQDGEQQRLFIENKTRISISGMQEKYSLKLTDNILELADRGGEYILKPVPTGLINTGQVPANEHLTMQLAKQVYKMPVAENALMFFNDGPPAYITRRFDVKTDGNRCLKEDFASLAQLTEKNAGKTYKYDYSYEGIANLIDNYFPAAITAKERLFELVIFNYLFSNGDAHLKNFSRIDCSVNGDALLSPAYDLINTRLHVDDSDLALKDGLYEGDYKHPSYSTYGCYCYDDFYEFGKRIGLVPVRIKRMLLKFIQNETTVYSFISRSFLNGESKKKYTDLYNEKKTRLSKSLAGII